jgi:tryptophan synthase alpha chain
MVKTFRSQDAETPVVLMGYANPIERFDGIHGERAFVNAAKAAGVDGILVVDYPPEECESFAADLRAQDIDLIFLLAPTSTDERMALVGKLATGYVYYVSLKGVTGAGHLDTDAVAAMLPRIRQFIKIPVGVGFGIRDAATAKGVGIGADAVVIGSKVIQIAEGESEANVGPAVGTFLAEIRQALDTLPPL